MCRRDLARSDRDAARELVRGSVATFARCGIDRLIIVPGSLDSDPAVVRQSLDRLASDVVPSLTRDEGPHAPIRRALTGRLDADWR